MVALILLLAPAGALAQSASPADQLKGLTGHIDSAMAQLKAGNVSGAQTEYKGFNDAWPGVETGVRQTNRDMYRDIEAKMTDVQAAFTAQPADVNRISASLDALDGSVDKFTSQYSTVAPAAAQSSSSEASPAGAMAAQLGLLVDAQQRITAQDAPGAAKDIQDFIRGWPSVEGTVATKDGATYTRIENDMAQAYGLLTSNPPNYAQASTVVGDMQTRLAPYGEEVRYGVFDAAIILLREGFEALLVFAALLAFLKRSGNGDKQGWIWAGGGAGLALSAVIAVVVNVAFARAGGSSRELLEGVTGLVAAGMLLWMMFWLHSKSNIHTWNRYISERSSRALAANSLMGLALIAFLAVLREGAETVLFYIGIAPAIDTGQLLAGLAVGGVALVLVAVLMLVVGVRIPIRPFFLVTSVLVFFLAFKFAGMGVHSLQVAGYLQAHSAGYLPSVDFFGVFPTWETTLVQILILAGTAAGLRFAASREHDHAPAAQQQQVGAGSGA
ncbi:MAG: FTR1 family protein [Chloroflexota bacterium]